MILQQRVTMWVLVMIMANVMAQDTLVVTPGQFSVSICHRIPYIGGTCTGFANTATCNRDKCEDGAVNEELTNKYKEFISNQQQRLDENRDQYSYLPSKDTLLLVNGQFVTVPKAVYTMTKLTEITIIESKLRKINLNDFLTVPKLKKIYLINNTITTIETYEKSNDYSTVENIDVSFNFIEAVPNNFVSRFSKLEHLNMSHNMISSIGKQAFEGTVQLKTLDLSHNRLKEVENIFIQLPRLTQLNDGQSRDLQKLSKLFLDNNLIVKIDFKEFFKTGILELSIGGNQIPCNELASVKFSKLGDKFNRIVTSKNFSSVENVNSINGISCEQDTVIDSDYPSSNTIVLIKTLKNELENTKKQLEFMSEGFMVLFDNLNRQLSEIKKNLPPKHDLE